MEKWRTMLDSEKPIFPNTLEEQEEALKTDEQMTDFIRIREERKDDRFKPRYHFSRPHGSLNDPNGLCFWEGRWHLFYQSCDSRIHWGHAISDDLVTWRDLPHAIYPEYEDHCFSGGTYVDEENHRVIAAHYGYTGYEEGKGWRCGTMIANSSDPLLLNWEKINDRKAVIPDADAPCWRAPDMPPVPDQKPYQVFDSFIWKEDGVYYILNAGYSTDPVTGRRFRQEHLLRCEDDDLLHWEYVKPFLEHDRFSEAGDDGACPYFLPLGDKHLFIHFSHRAVPKYILGSYKKETHEFFPQNGARLTSGYQVVTAPSAYPLPDGDAVCVYNMNEKGPADGWGGILTIPRRLSVGGAWKDELWQSPIDLSKLHTSHDEVVALELAEGETKVLDKIGGDCYEMTVKLKSDDIPDTLEIDVLRSPDAKERTRITFYREKGGMYAILPYTTDSVVSLNTSESSLDPAARIMPDEILNLPKERSEDLEFRIFVDRSVVEVFVNGKVVLQSRVYPSRDDSVGIAFTALRGNAMVEKIDVWGMGSMYR